MTKMMTVQEFMARFPDDDACLHHVMKCRFGFELDCMKCGKHGTFRRIRSELAYSCPWCGHHIHPMVGTLFHRSHTPLQKWFYAMYLFTTSRHGVSAKELQRQLGVMYKTAWRMGHEIRKYLAKIDGNGPLDGEIEVDESYFGGKRSGGKRGRGAPGKTVIMGMQDRDGELITAVIPDVKRKTLHPIIEANVVKGSTVHTDELASYTGIEGLGFKHLTCNHGAGQYAVNGSHVNMVEAFWSIFKRSVRSTHVWVSQKHLPKYLAEFEARHNLRKAQHLMLPRMLAFQP